MTPETAVEILRAYIIFKKKKINLWKSTGAMNYPKSKKEVLTWEGEVLAFELAVRALSKFKPEA